MSRNWIEYGKGPRKSRPGELYASINSQGSVVINRHTYEAMNRPDAVVLMYDPETDAIGLKPVPPTTVNAFPVFKNDKTHRRINCGPLVKEHALPITGTDRFPTARVEEGVLTLELKYRVPASRTRKGSHEA